MIAQIHITCPSPAPSTASLLSALSVSTLRMLDVEQTRIHGLDHLSVVAELASADAAQALLDGVHLEHEGLDVRVVPLDAAAYAGWLDQQQAVRHVMTLSGRALGIEQLQQALCVVEANGLKVERIERLSLPLTAGAPQACLQVTLSGEREVPGRVRETLLALSDALNMDIALQLDSRFRQHRRLAVFDMDSTLIQAEVIDELAKAAGVGEQVAEITERAMRGELDFKASFKARMALLKGLPETVLEGIGQQLRLTDGAEALFAELKRLGYKTAILSGGFTYFARQIQTRLGIDYVYANELQIVDGLLTGEAVEPIVDAQRKADLLRMLAAQEGLDLEQTIAVGDGANDLPMLAAAGLGVAFRAKPLVRQSARQTISILGLDGVLYLLGQHDRYRSVPIGDSVVR